MACRTGTNGIKARHDKVVGALGVLVKAFAPSAVSVILGDARCKAVMNSRRIARPAPPDQRADHIPDIIVDWGGATGEGMEFIDVSIGDDDVRNIELKKQNQYTSALRDGLFPRKKLVIFAMDTFGGIGSEADAWLSKIAMQKALISPTCATGDPSSRFTKKRLQEQADRYKLSLLQTIECTLATAQAEIAQQAIFLGFQRGQAPPAVLAARYEEFAAARRLEAASRAGGVDGSWFSTYGDTFAAGLAFDFDGV